MASRWKAAGGKGLPGRICRLAGWRAVVQAGSREACWPAACWQAGGGLGGPTRLQEGSGRADNSISVDLQADARGGDCRSDSSQMEGGRGRRRSEDGLMSGRSGGLMQEDDSEEEARRWTAVREL